jgi:kinesin family protein 5
MLGPDAGAAKSMDSLDLQGICPRLVRTLFSRIETAEESILFEIRVSFVEIYLERIKDLLNAKKDDVKLLWDAKKNAGHLKDVTEVNIEDESQVYTLIKRGNKLRRTAEHQQSAKSSRSHAVFILNVKQTNTVDMSVKNSQLCLVDLAGSE